MTGVLALVGGGEWSEGCDFDRSLIEASGASEVAVLPTGSAYENPRHLLDRAVPWFEALGLSVVPVNVLTRRDAFDEEAVARVASSRFIYLAGASAMHLRSVLKDTPVLAALVAAWESGAALVGTNAGADVLCDPMVDSRGGAFTVGLGLVSPLAAIPRFDQWSHDKVRRTVELAPSGLALVGIPQRTALMLDPDVGWRVEGAEVVTVFVDGQPATLAELPLMTARPVADPDPSPGRRPDVSVVMTTHETPAPLLAIALSSLLDQTLRSIELVLVADGDLDEDSRQVVTDLVKADPRLVVIEPGRVGRGRALNLGVDAARAPLVAIQDADDASHPRRFEIQVEVFRSLPELAALGTGVVLASGPRLRADWDLPHTPLRVSRVNRSLLCSNSVLHSSLMMRREVMTGVGAYDERRMAQFDYDLLLRTRAAGYLIGYCNLPLVLHRRHAAQYFEGLQPFNRAWSSCRLQLSNIAEEQSRERFVYYGVAMVRLAYQVTRGFAWHRAIRRVTPEGGDVIDHHPA